MRRTILSVVALVTSFLTVSASAVDLTGIWSGKFSCSYTFSEDGFLYTYTDYGQILKISQDIDTNKLYVQYFNNEANLQAHFSGFIIDHLLKPSSKGRVSLADCKTSSDLTADNTFSEIAFLSAAVNPIKGTGVLKGDSVYSYYAEGEIGKCRWSFRRTNPEDPHIGTRCPPSQPAN